MKKLTFISIAISISFIAVNCYAIDFNWKHPINSGHEMSMAINQNHNDIKTQLADIQNNQARIKVNQSLLQQHQSTIDANTQDIHTAQHDIETNQSLLQQHQNMIDTNTQDIHTAQHDIKASQSLLQQHQNTIDTNTQDIHTAQHDIKASQSLLQQHQNTIDTNTQDIHTAQRDIKTNQHNIDYNSQQIKSTMNQTSSNAAIIEQWKLEENQQLNTLHDEIHENRERSSMGIAGVAAISNIPTPAIPGTFSIGVGFGNYDSESALAFGVSKYLTSGISIKGSVAVTHDQPVWGAGMSITY